MTSEQEAEMMRERALTLLLIERDQAQEKLVLSELRKRKSPAVRQGKQPKPPLKVDLICANQQVSLLHLLRTRAQ
jgi:hypothetical protein